jgi:hypothetical protein
MNQAAIHTDGLARVRLLDQQADRLIVGLPTTNYQLHLTSTADLRVEIGKRVIGRIRCKAWKLDYVSAGGSFIEPILGRPRRVQGRVIGSLGSHNTLVVEVCGTPIVTELPDRWQADAIQIGTHVGVDVYDGATFHPVA